MSKKRRITVILPVYNASPYVEASILSILNQTYSDFELIIINDGSTDDSKEIIAKFEDPRIVFIDRSENIGLVGTLNQGIEQARGEIIARLDADDLCCEDRFEKQMNWLDTHPEVGVVGSNIQILDDDGVSEVEVRFPENSVQIKWAMFFFSAVSHGAAMIRKDVLNEVGRFRLVDSNGLDIYSIEDYDLWFRALRITEFHNIQEPLTLVRKHESNITRTNLERHVENANQLARNMINDILDQELPIDAILRIRAIRDRSLRIGKSDISLYHRLLEEFLRQQRASPSDERLVRYDASSMLLISWRQSETLHDTLQLIWTGFRISPSATLDFSREMFPKLVRKLITFERYTDSEPPSSNV